MRRKKQKRMGRVQREILELLSRLPMTTTQIAQVLDRKYSSVRRALRELEAKYLVAGSFYVYSSPQIRAVHMYVWRLTSDEERKARRLDRRIDLRNADLIRKIIEERAAKVEEVAELERELFSKKTNEERRGSGLPGADTR